MHPETFQPLSIHDFCVSEVEPCTKHADEVQIQALSKALRTGVRVCYLDASEVHGGDSGADGEGVLNWVDFEMEEQQGVGEEPLVMLYR